MVYWVHYNLSNSALVNFLKAARWVVFDDQDASVLYVNSKDPKFNDGVGLEKYNIENEVKAWALIKETCEAALKRYPTTLLEDIELLRNGDNLSFNQKMCITFRRGEKEILKFLIECADGAKFLSTKTAKEARTEIKAWNERYDRAVRYFNDDFCDLLKQ